jgi:hypothetical protein
MWGLAPREEVKREVKRVAQGVCGAVLREHGRG